MASDKYRRRDGGVDQPSRGLGQYWPLAERKKGKPQIGKAVSFNGRLCRQADDGVIAKPPGEFVKEVSGILAGGRHSTATSNSRADRSVS